MNLRKNKIVLLIISCIVITALVVFANVTDKNKSSFKGANTLSHECEVSLVEIGEVCLINEVILQWLDNPGKVDTVEKMYEQYREFGRLDYPVPVKIAFSVNNVPSDIEIVKKEVAISENKDLSEAIYVDVPVHQNEVDVYNLKTACTYFYCVTVYFSNGTEAKSDSAFKTADTPRYLYVDGIRNIRDIGGKQNIHGKTIKQGMIYRGTEMDGAISQGKFVITEKGVDTLVNELKIKLQMDLRASNLENAKDLLPPEIPRKSYTTFSYAETFGKHGVKSLRKVFADLAEPSNYPIYAHCTYGGDRTGTIVYLMEAVLGVDEESLYNEWALSSFFSGTSFSKEMDEFVDIIKSYRGDSIQEKVSNYLLSIGVTQKQLDSFRQIMLTEE